jgi:hypothetical protein
VRLRTGLHPSPYHETAGRRIEAASREPDEGGCNRCG